MSVEQYLFLLRAELTGFMSQEELEDILRYYTEYFEEAGPERQRDVMVELGSPQRLAEKILGHPTEENMTPAEPYTYAVQEADYIPQTRGGMPRWLFICILAAVAIIAGPVLLSIVFGLGASGLVCVAVGLGLLASGVGKLPFAGLLYLGGGGLITVAVGLFLLVGASAAVWGIVKLIRWFHASFVEGGFPNEEDY